MTMGDRLATLKRRVRSAGGRFIRRIGLLPGGMPDGLGQDDDLESLTLDSDVIVYFADTPDAAYQLNDWYPIFRVIDEEMGLTIFCLDSRSAAKIRQRSGLTTYTISQDSTFDAIVSRSDVKVCLYVNFSVWNTLALRLRSLIHVSLLHGDSDKAVSVSNQVKAYDFSFVAGQAAIDRFAAYTALFDAQSRCIPVGYPDLEVPSHSIRDDRGASRDRAGSTAVSVLYAPTWEGGHPSVAYGSVESHGLALVTSLIEQGFRVIYRPHPLTGVRVPAYGLADARIREFVSMAQGSFVSENRDLRADFAEADILVADISAVANEWLHTLKPLIVTLPAEPAAAVTSTRLLETVVLLDERDATDAGRIVAEVIREHDPEAFADLLTYYYGDTSQGATAKNVLRELRKLCALRDEKWSAIVAAQEGGRTGGHQVDL